MKNAFFLIVGLLFIFGSIYLFLQKPASDRFQTNNFLTIGNTRIKIEIADTDEKRIQGLSGRESLKEGSGMLFIFDVPATQGFWMKDMKFPIDIIWINSEKAVLGVEEKVSPDTFPQIFYSPSPAQYVLEVPSGTFKKSHLMVGDKISWY